MSGVGPARPDRGPGVGLLASPLFSAVIALPGTITLRLKDDNDMPTSIKH